MTESSGKRTSLGYPDYARYSLLWCLYAWYNVNDGTAQRSGTSRARYSSYVIHCFIVVPSLQACSGAHEYRWNICGRACAALPGSRG
ncbi:hypothetical protein VTO73DRAFT_2297 [Trametes versicolor]